MAEGEEGKTLLAVEDVVSSVAPTRHQPDPRKLRELILYVSWACESDPTFGATKLNKILFFSDFLAYLHLGAPITGQEYRALDQGPAPRDLVTQRKKLEKDGSLVVRARDFFGKRQKQTIALRKPDLTGFTAEEIAIVDRVIRDWWGRTAAEMSQASHEFVGWQLAEAGETIPYEAALLEDHEPTTEELKHATALEQMARDALAELHG